jgi:hypothetical protein
LYHTPFPHPNLLLIFHTALVRAEAFTGYLPFLEDLFLLILIRGIIYTIAWVEIALILVMVVIPHLGEERILFGDLVIVPGWGFTFGAPVAAQED